MPVQDGAMSDQEGEDSATVMGGEENGGEAVLIPSLVELGCGGVGRQG